MPQKYITNHTLEHATILQKIKIHIVINTINTVYSNFIALVVQRFDNLKNGVLDDYIYHASKQVSDKDRYQNILPLHGLFLQTVKIFPTNLYWLSFRTNMNATLHCRVFLKSLLLIQTLQPLFYILQLAEIKNHEKGKQILI